ncbi:MAG: hypothetical protein PHX80_05365 [Candidatus Nanoarchaeia archaeon]|nr:hypothetical protein [Candidatus Nanoarchaeia archaeon]
MRQIAIKNIQLPDRLSVYIKQKQYCVFLGNDTRHYFSALKDAKCFLAVTNRFLNDQLHELNYLYGIIFTEYRNIWFYLTSYQKAEDQFISSFAAIDRYFYNAVVKSHGPNGNVFAFNNLFGICNTLADLTSEIMAILQAKKFFVDLRRVKSFEKQVRLINKELKSYGK